MSDVVIDASVTLTWLFGEEQQSRNLQARLDESGLVAPALWRLEVVNAILVKERRKQIKPAQGTRFLQILEALEIEIVGEPKNRGMEQLALFARPHQLSTYDAIYLELASVLGLPLWTYDSNLIKAAKKLGMTVV